jgi:hypothetical protein
MEFEQVIGLVSSVVGRGWQGLITLYVAWAVIKQFKVWQDKREAEAKGLKHNPNPEVHEAIDASILPLRGDIAELRNDIGDVRDRVSRLEGRLE